MKKIIFLIILSAGTAVVKAQSIEQGKQQLYYERYESAKNTFHNILMQDPGNPGAWFELTRTYLLQNDISRAFDSIQLAPTSVKTDPYYKVAYGSILLHQNKKEDAARYFSEALAETREKNAGILAAIAETHINSNNGNGNYAVKLLNKAIKRDKKNPVLYVLLGDAHRKLLNGTEAYKAYQNAIEHNNKYAIAYHRIGEIFITQKNPGLYVDYFKKALTADPYFAPSLYKLYVYELYHDPAKAMDYYKDYLTKSDPSFQNEYDMADLLYLNKHNEQAIQKAKAIISIQGEKVQPRLFKLIGYSLAAINDTAQAINYMQKYFVHEADSNLILKDYISMAEFYSTMPDQDSLAAEYYSKAIGLEKDSTAVYDYYKRLADIAQKRKDYVAQAAWLGKYYIGNDNVNNLDLFNWGLALYRAEDFVMADSIFGMYSSKYPEQSFGYYWQAKSKALQDEEMKEGLAVPTYKKLIEILQKDSTDANYKKWIVESYGYLAAYEVNTLKDYAEAVHYFEKILELDPENESAKKYITILEKDLATQNSKR